MSNIKTHIKIAVDIPTTDPQNKLLIEPGINGVVILSDGQFKVGVDKQVLIDAIRELDWMKIRHSIPEETKSETPEPALGEIIEGDDTDIPF